MRRRPYTMGLKLLHPRAPRKEMSLSPRPLIRLPHAFRDLEALYLVADERIYRACCSGRGPSMNARLSPQSPLG